MIVLDENLHSGTTITAISSWYRGRVVSVTGLRPGSVIKDEAIPELLRRARQPTFVTINVSDFWRKAPLHQRYCIVTVDVPTNRIGTVPDLLRAFLRYPEFTSKAIRMGKIVRINAYLIEYYGPDGRVHTLRWPR